MVIREPCLPPGWYPRQKAALEEFLSPFERSGGSPQKPAARAAIAPHAGWYYSGRAAALAVASLDPDAETIAVIGGHLSHGMSILAAGEDAVNTPLGTMKIDAELRAEFGKLAFFRPDRYHDNTVEVLLPMARYFFPEARLLWLRFPAEQSSFDAGKFLDKAAGALGRRVAVLASTDLTHYGDNYDFTPRGGGMSALEWVKKVNDAAFIEAVLEKDPVRVLERAEKDHSACSAGAVLGALGFVSSMNVHAALLDYRTSAEAGGEHALESIPDSFVGYAAISFSQDM